MSTAKAKPTSKPAARKPLLVAGTDSVASKPKAASRPILQESDVFRREIGDRLKEVTGAIDIIDATELQADADFDNAIRMLTEKRDAERDAQALRRHDLNRVLDGCKAALNASEEQQQAAE